MAGLSKILKPLSNGAFSFGRFILHNWYWVVLFIVLIPSILSSISLARQESNPAIPFIQLGLVLANADAQIAKDVQTLKENPQELIGMEKPTQGIWAGFKYKWHIVKIIFRELGLIWTIFFPFIIIFKVLKHRNQSESGKNFFLTMIYGVLFIFLINLVMIIYGFVNGTIAPAQNLGNDMYKITGLIILQALPFHGLISLIQYCVTLL